MTDVVIGTNILDRIYITDMDDSNVLVDITALPGFEVWYYTEKKDRNGVLQRMDAVIYSKESDAPHAFVVEDDNYYRAYLDTTGYDEGQLCADVYVATTNDDLEVGYFKNIGTKKFELNLVNKPISERV